MYVWMSTSLLAVVLVAIVGGTAGVGLLVGRRTRVQRETHREPVGWRRAPCWAWWACCSPSA